MVSATRPGGGEVAPTHRLGPHKVLAYASTRKPSREATPAHGPASTRTSPTISPEMHDAPLPDLILYGRPDCRLCDEARDTVISLLRQRAEAGQPGATLVERDIETDDVWQRTYFASIPVLELGDRRLELATSQAKIRRLLADGLD